MILEKKGSEVSKDIVSNLLSRFFSQNHPTVIAGHFWPIFFEIQTMTSINFQHLCPSSSGFRSSKTGKESLFPTLFLLAELCHPCTRTAWEKIYAPPDSSWLMRSPAEMTLMLENLSFCAFLFWGREGVT